MVARTIEHVSLDIYLDVDDGGASLRFGPDLKEDQIPCDGEVIRVGGLLYKVGLMDTSEPPMLHRTEGEPEYGLWWDADEGRLVIQALWNGRRDRYEWHARFDGKEWDNLMGEGVVTLVSADGDNWTDQLGRVPTGRFDEAEIILVDGPRDGEHVG